MATTRSTTDLLQRQWEEKVLRLALRVTTSPEAAVQLSTRVLTAAGAITQGGGGQHSFAALGGTMPGALRALVEVAFKEHPDGPQTLHRISAERMREEEDGQVFSSDSIGGQLVALMLWSLGAVADIEVRRSLFALVRILPPTSAVLFILSDIDSFTCGELGEFLDWPRQTVKRVVHRARLQLMSAHWCELASSTALMPPLHKVQ